MLTFVRTCDTSACYVTSWVGWGGVGMLTFVRTCDTSACYVTSWVGWCGVGMLTFVRTCDTSACYVASWVGFWFAQVEWIQCGNCLNQQFPVALRPGWTAHVNPKLMRSIRIWQWRWMNSKENVLEKTGRMLDKRMCSWKGKNSREFLAQKSL